MLGSAAQSVQIIMLTKLGATLTNTVVADVVVVPLYFAVKKALERGLPAEGRRR